MKIVGSVERRIDVAAMTTPEVGTAEAPWTSWIHQYTQGVRAHTSNIRRCRQDRQYDVECSRCRPNLRVMYACAIGFSAIENVWASVPPTNFQRRGRFRNLVSKCTAAPENILYKVRNMLFFYQV